MRRNTYQLGIFVCLGLVLVYWGTLSIWDMEEQSVKVQFGKGLLRDQTQTGGLHILKTSKDLVQVEPLGCVRTEKLLGGR